MIDFQNAGYFKLHPVAPQSFGAMVQPLLIEGEGIIACYQSVRDGLVFTSKRIIAINIQGLTGKKKDFTSLPYSKIQAFSLETAGLLPASAKLTDDQQHLLYLYNSLGADQQKYVIKFMQALRNEK
jgi:hypothetical protein